MRRLKLVFTLIVALGVSPALFASAMFDHHHSLWNQLLRQHVSWVSGGVASQVDYAGLQRNRAALNVYLRHLSSVNRTEYNSWHRDQQLAFLINAYNAFTVELILTKYPNLDSIKDLGSFLRSPWKKEFFTLLGERRHLDNVEHDMIRGEFNEPLIHVAVVCASIGCPALRDHAFTSENLESSLTDSMRRFLSDRSRNRYNAERKTLQVSKIFDWYRGDFEKDQRGYRELSDLFAAHATELSADPAVQALIKAGRVPIEFIKYDWGLNDVSSNS